MQDKYLDEQFADRAWEEMRNLLDEEMPVEQPRRRRGLFWLFFLLSLLIGGLSAWGIYSSSNNIPGNESNKEVANFPIAETTTSAASAALEENEKNSLEPSNKNQSSKSADQKTTAEITEQEKTSIALETRKVEPEIDHLQKLSNAQVSNKILLPSSFMEIDQTKVGVGNRDILPVIPFLTPLPLSFNYETKLASLPETNFKKRASILPDYWGVSASLLFGNGNWLSGLTLGLFGDYRFGRSKWSLRTGLNYRYQSRNFKRPGRGLALEDSFNASPDVPNTATDPDAEDTDNMSGANRVQLPDPADLSVRVHSLGLPVLIRFQASRRLGFQGGAELLYQFRARRSASQEVIQTDNTSLANFDRKTTYLFNAAAAATYENDVFRKFDLLLSAGMYYRISPRLNVHLNYFYGLNDLVESEYYSSYNQVGSLGVSYFFR